jgi:predicted 3-demethylubiquinone-9 3-methyltransferase (glyoxalase superfamily)
MTLEVPARLHGKGSPRRKDETMLKLRPCLWFDTEAEVAAEHYVSIFPNSRILEVSRYGEAGPGEPGTVMTVIWEMNGQEFMGLNGGPIFSFSEAISFEIHCKDQAEVDHYWERLLEGGEPSQCGWLKDKFGLSWQVVPVRLNELLADPDAGRAQAAMKAMLGMQKIEVAELERAADSVKV